MSLSQELIAKFVKVTNDSTKPQTETTLYGTITEYAGELYVKLDGSNHLTPLSSMESTADIGGVKINDRVTVMIKNHTATITGNLTAPSVNTNTLNEATGGAADRITRLENLVADKVSSDALIAIQGRINSLETNQLIVNNTLNAQSGAINELKTFDLTVNNTFEAHKALIDDLDTKKIDADVVKSEYASIKRLESIEGAFHTLESTYTKFSETTVGRLDAAEATIETLDTTYAKVSELRAAEARIGDLETGSAKINTLIFGSATGTSIQTSFSNSVIAQLGNAQIKSAMIENVSAAKITAGDIITDNVRVKSNDGRLIIADQTIQISDANRVRVQIGKDASNDYSINIWDASGNLMFSKGGITDSAIKEAIIRNDMVSDTANIAAHKLDIDSLFEEINGSTKTIKSTRVYLDENKQTLDVLFKSLSSTVTSQGETITSQGTAISTIQGQITSKIWQQDINTAKNEMSTQYSTLEQSLNSYKTTVGETYATISDVEGIKIGGRNLLLDSAKTVENAEYILAQISFADPDSIKAGETFTISFDGMLSDPVQKGFYINVFPSPHKGCCSINAISKDGVYHRYKATFIMPDNGSFTRIGIYSAEVGNFKLSGVKNVKLERGDKATDWTPAPEDVDADISALDTRVLSAESSITQLSNKITANVSETTNLGTRMTTVEQTASDLTIELSNLQIGGRNLLRDGRLILLRSNNDSLYPISCTETIENGVVFYRIKRINIETYPSTAMSLYSLLSKTTFAYGEMTGKQVTLSFKARTSHTITGTFMCYTYGGDSIVEFSKPSESFTTEWKTYSVTIDEFPDMANRTGIHWNPLNFNIPSDVIADFYLDIRDYKFEFGNKATDWTPAPEEVDDSILTASKTATDYLNFSSAGLVVGDLTASTLGKNVLIGSNDIRIRTGTTDNAVFGADLIELAKDNMSATISMLDGAFKIYYDADNSDGGFGVYGVTSTGEERLAFQPVNENDNLTIGWGGYAAKANCTNIYGHNMNLLAGNDLAIECDDWKINIDGNLLAKASAGSFVELIGLSSDDNTAIGHGGYSAAIGKTNIYGNKIQHIVNTKSGSASYKPYYEAGDSFETEWYGAGFISSQSKVVYFSIPLSKPIIGSTTPNVTVANATTGKGGLQVRQDSNYVFGSSSTEKATPSSYSAKVVGNGNFILVEATMANNTNAVNNAPCGINANIKITFS